MNIIISGCSTNKNIIKKFLNHNNILEFKVDWVEVIKKILDLSEYGNHELNDNLEKNLIYLLDIILQSNDDEIINNVNFFYKYTRGGIHRDINYGKGDSKYEYVLDDMPDLEIRFISLLNIGFSLISNLDN